LVGRKWEGGGAGEKRGKGILQRVDGWCNLVGFGNGRDNVHMDLAGWFWMDEDEWILGTGCEMEWRENTVG
jgi:hypothetical protein